MTDQKRPYRMQRRAELEEATRQRITESAEELHGTVGPSRTSISAVAERAGVRRSTVYRHFPDEFALFAAFALTWRIPADYGYVALWCALAAAAFLHWREIGPSRLGRKGALVMLVLALAIGAQTLTQSEAFDDTGRQVTSRRLLPPWLRVVPIRNADHAFADIAQLKGKLDLDRMAK